MKLIVKKYGQQITEITLESGREYFIGRDEECDVVLSAEAGISRRHFKLHSPRENCWVIESVSSQEGGLYVEGEAAAGAEIEDSTSLTFKSYIFEFVLEGAGGGAEEGKPEEEAMTEPAMDMPSAEEAREAIPEENLEAEEEAEVEEQLETEEEAEEMEEGTRLLPPADISYFLALSIDGSNPEYLSLNQGDCWELGRKEDCDICINHPSLSARHLKITKKESRFFVEDLKSSNGTFLNDAKLEPGKPEPLRSDDVIEALNLTLTFEARNRKFTELVKSSPPPGEGRTMVMESPESPSGMALPKVVLEESSGEDEESGSGGKKKFFNPKRIVLLSVLALTLGGALYVQLNQPKEEEKLSPEQEAESARMKAVQDFYRMASVLYQQKKYRFCIENLNKLHEMTSFHKDSKELLNQCQNALSARERLEEQEALKKQEAETEEKILKITSACKPKLDVFESVEELNVCLAEALQLNPGHAEIGALQRVIEERESLKRLKEQEKEEARKRIAERRGRYQALYRKVRKQYDQAKESGDQERLLKAAEAYDRFVKSARGESYMAKEREGAAVTAKSIRENYKNTLEGLYSNCENFINQKKMKRAYPVCKQILDFKDGDAKALQWMEQARSHLRRQLKPLYDQSVMLESLSKISSARPLWEQIVERDIESGYYYKKAKSKLEKYK